MAKVTIEIEDIGDSGKVAIHMTPKFGEIIGQDLAGFMKLTPAHGYALRIARECLKMSKENEPTQSILIPGAMKV